MTNQTKICSKCGVEKSTEEFNKDVTKLNNRYSSCKQCRKLVLKVWGIKHREKHNLQSREWEKRNKDKKNAHGAVRRALKNRSIVKDECYICGDQETVAHHPIYEQKLWVIWLCLKHHYLVHTNKNFGDKIALQHHRDFADCHAGPESGCTCGGIDV